MPRGTWTVDEGGHVRRQQDGFSTCGHGNRNISNQVPRGAGYHSPSRLSPYLHPNGYDHHAELSSSIPYHQYPPYTFMNYTGSHPHALHPPRPYPGPSRNETGFTLGEGYHTSRLHDRIGMGPPRLPNNRFEAGHSNHGTHSEFFGRHDYESGARCGVDDHYGLPCSPREIFNDDLWFGGHGFGEGLRTEPLHSPPRSNDELAASEVADELNGDQAPYYRPRGCFVNNLVSRPSIPPPYARHYFDDDFNLDMHGGHQGVGLGNTHATGPFKAGYVPRDDSADDELYRHPRGIRPTDQVNIHQIFREDTRSREDQAADHLEGSTDSTKVLDPTEDNLVGDEWESLSFEEQVSRLERLALQEQSL